MTISSFCLILKQNDDIVILFQDEGTAGRAALKFVSDFVCVSMREPFDADNTELEPLRERYVYVWASKRGVVDDDAVELMWTLQDEVDAEVLTSAEFLALLI